MPIYWDPNSYVLLLLDITCCSILLLSRVIRSRTVVFACSCWPRQVRRPRPQCLRSLQSLAQPAGCGGAGPPQRAGGGEGARPETSSACAGLSDDPGAAHAGKDLALALLPTPVRGCYPSLGDLRGYDAEGHARKMAGRFRRGKSRVAGGVSPGGDSVSSGKT